MKQQLINLLLTYFRYFARKTIEKNRPTIIGITGSAGKSSARTILYSVLKDHYKTKVVAENSEIGMPLGILGLKPKSLGFETFGKSLIDWLRLVALAPRQTNNLKGTKYLIVEMGIDDPYPPKNMEYLLTIVKPDIAIYLNAFAGAVHSMQFEKIIPEGVILSPEEKREIKSKAIAAEKAKIITQSDCKVGIYNGDNPYVVDSLSLWNNNNHTRLLTFGGKQAEHIKLTDYAVSLKGTSFTFSLKEPKEKMTVTLHEYLLQKDYGFTIAAVILSAVQTGLSLKQIKHSLETNFSLPNSRASMLTGIHDSIIIDSSYNASRPAVEGMLDLLPELKKDTKHPTVFLFGDMRELGEESQTEHELVTEKMAGIVDYLYCVGKQTQKYVLPLIGSELKIKDSKLKEVRWFANAKYAGEYLKQHLPPKAIVLVKGSQNTIFLEEAIKDILADKKDANKLCRQDDYWLKVKSRTFDAK